ncbi:Tigger transposable element-derived protein 2 [Portunus trituberculatus]|uniref:Tigger transposable element-derived protein 2 n=1 Tax=Portunus trituberculatus TaxID=210409 RepID=A0A5B7GKT3_PORTR|nr:Tigger transposable element-derived protein 2 [Portunus trituberculatus]
MAGAQRNQEKEESRPYNTAEAGDIGQAEGGSIGNVTHEYGIGNATVTDIKKAGPQLRQFTQRHLPAVSHHKKKDSGLRTMKIGKYQKLDEVLFKWHQQHVSFGLPLRGGPTIFCTSFFFFFLILFIFPRR